MTIEIKVPVLPESVTDATIAKWHKKPGEMVKQDENLVDIETDKIVLEVVAPQDGKLTELKAQDGQIVQANAVIGLFTAENIKTDKVLEPDSEKTNTDSHSTSNDTNAAPAARRLAQSKNIDISTIPGTGKHGRVTTADIDTSNQIESSSKDELSSSDVLSKERKVTRVPMSRLRKKVAERLLSAQQNSAILTTFNEVDLQSVMNLRKEFQDDFTQKYGIKLGFMSFFAKAVIAGLKKFPSINAAIEGDDILYHEYFDIGIAVSSDRGLVVPVLKDADSLAMNEIETKIKDFGQRAQSGKLELHEMSGGTFTISNGGVFGSLLSTPILNPPQSAILGMHKIQMRPIVEDGQVVVRPMMYVALSYDHRIIDGRESVSFLATVKDVLENPAKLILGL